MHCITIKATTLWLNIDNVAVITYKNDASVYQCAHLQVETAFICTF